MCVSVNHVVCTCMRVCVREREAFVNCVYAYVCCARVRVCCVRWVCFGEEEDNLPVLMLLLAFLLLKSESISILRSMSTRFSQVLC